MQNGVLDKNESEKLRQLNIQQHRLAYQIASVLRGISPNKVTYVISHEIVIDSLDPKIRLITRIHELPEIHIHHNKTDVLGEFIQDIDVVALESSL